MVLGILETLDLLLDQAELVEAEMDLLVVQEQMDKLTLAEAVEAVEALKVHLHLVHLEVLE